MKTLFKSISLLALLAFCLAPALARAQDDGPDDQDVSFQVFYDQLGDQGSWIQTDDYGYVFQPNVSDPDWSPYTDGYWVDSPAGFTWVSDEPWGWATYHYGRWANIDGCGWVWVPGYRWAPAWVSWRYGGGYCGWAPLPPETLYGEEYEEPGVRVGIGFHFGGDVDVSFGIGAGYYNFVRVEDFGDRDYRHHRIPRDNNFVVINRTTNITNINVNDRGGRGNRFSEVAAGGPPVNEINARSRQHIEKVNFTETNQPGKSTVQGNSLAIFAPKVDPGSIRQDRPKTVSQQINRPTFNRGESITKPLDVTSSVKGAQPSADAIQKAEVAQREAPASAKIGTSQTHTKTFDKPITSLTPVTGTGNQSHQANGFNRPGSQGANNVNPNVQSNPNNTGAPGNTHSQNTFAPNNGNNVNRTFNSQGQDNGATGQGGDNQPVHHTSSTPNFQQQNQDQGQGENNFHRRPDSQNQDTGGDDNRSSQTTAPPVFHPQNQGGGQGGGSVHPANTPGPGAPQNPGGNGNGGNKPSGHPQGGGGNGNKSSGGNNGGQKDQDHGNNH